MKRTIGELITRRAKRWGVCIKQAHKLFGLIFIVIFILSAANLVHAIGVTDTIMVGYSPEGVAYDSGKGEIFVANCGSNTVSVISDSTNTVVATIPVGDCPYNLAYDSGKGEVFVANFVDGTVSVISDSPEATTAPSPTASTSQLPSPTSSPSSTSTASASPTPKSTPAPTTTENGSGVNLAISGNITRSQMSNLTITTDSSAKTTTLSFIVTGESGTTGFSNITIPKRAVPYGTSPLVTINGTLASNQGYTQDSNNYYVWYTTHFSTHKISIVFDTTTTPTNPSTSSSGSQNTALSLDWVQLAILVMMGIIVVAVGAGCIFVSE